MTSHRKTENNELIFGVHNHFQSGIFPITIQGREYVVDAETPVDCGELFSARYGGSWDNVCQ